MLEAVVPAASLGEREARVSASAGVSLYPLDAADPATLIRNADLALHQVKSTGRTGCQRYGPQIGAILLRRMSMEKGLAQALERRQFHLYYQPQTDVHRKPVGTEALIRWASPELGLVSPADFIPVAEETGLIVPIGQWALAEACRQGAIWQRAGCHSLKMAVNISARQLSDDGIVDFVRRTLRESGLPPDTLELELTETALMDHADDSLVRLRQLRDLGVTIAIDDFGTGYSSLSYLQKLPVAVVKIDRSFVREVSDESGSTLPVIQAIVDLAHGMGLKVVGEGVETERQLQILRVMGCDVIQGYLTGRPAPANEIAACLFGGSPDLVSLDRQLRDAETCTEPIQLPIAH
jgi:EAL domain-containing protein (putative c-di-GMP-specific phosphodiesterase class I)